jgi:DNA repair protein RadB
MAGKISTGSKYLDLWLEGGYDMDTITTIYGPPGTGKTNLCILAAVNQAVSGNKVIYIDTEGSFSSDRLRQIAGSTDIMRNILLLRATTFWEQREVFNRLLQEIRKPVSLIIVDSISMLYRLELGFANQKSKEKALSINRALGRQLRILTEISRKKNIPVLVTNQVYSDFTRDTAETQAVKKIHMVGGDILKYWSKCLIELQKEDRKRRAIIIKHRSLPEKEIYFTITNDGVAKPGLRFW